MDNDICLTGFKSHIAEFRLYNPVEASRQRTASFSQACFLPRDSIANVRALASHTVTRCVKQSHINLCFLYYAHVEIKKPISKSEGENKPMWRQFLTLEPYSQGE